MFQRRRLAASERCSGLSFLPMYPQILKECMQPAPHSCLCERVRVYVWSRQSRPTAAGTATAPTLRPSPRPSPRPTLRQRSARVEPAWRRMRRPPAEKGEKGEKVLSSPGLGDRGMFAQFRRRLSVFTKLSCEARRTRNIRRRKWPCDSVSNLLCSGSVIVCRYLSVQLLQPLALASKFHSGKVGPSSELELPCTCLVSVPPS